MKDKLYNKHRLFRVHQSPCLLEVAHLVGGVNKMSSLPKEGMDTCGNDHCFNFSLFAS